MPTERIRGEWVATCTEYGDCDFTVRSPKHREAYQALTEHQQSTHYGEYTRRCKDCGTFTRMSGEQSDKVDYLYMVHRYIQHGEHTDDPGECPCKDYEHPTDPDDKDIADMRNPQLRTAEEELSAAAQLLRECINGTMTMSPAHIRSLLQSCESSVDIALGIVKAIP